MKLIFIRHGDPDYERDTLTEKGWKEAALLAERVAKWNVKEYYLSPLGRAQDTAAVSLNKIGKKGITLDWLKEFFILVQDPETGEKRIPWDFVPGWWTRQEAFYNRDFWAREPHLMTGAVDAEQKKVSKELDRLLAEHGYFRTERYYKVAAGNTDTLVFFCHMGVELLMLSHLLSIAAPVLWHGLFVAPTSVTVLCTEERKQGEAYFRCKCIGDVSHLYLGGEVPSDSGFFQEVYSG